MSVFSRIAGLSRTIEFGYPDAVRCLKRDRELLRDYKSDPDARSCFRQSQKLVAEWQGMLAELADLVFTHLPDVAARLRIVSPVTGTVQGTPGDLDALIGELRTIQAAAVRGVAPPDQDQDLDAKPVVAMPAELRKWIKDLPPDGGLREAYRRDRLFLIWNENEGGFGPVKIARRWNELPDAHRKLISPRLSVKVTDVVAKRGLAQAKRDRKPAPKGRSRKIR